MNVLKPKCMINISVVFNKGWYYVTLHDHINQPQSWERLHYNGGQGSS